MEFQNETTFEAELIHGPDGPEHHGVALIIKATLPLTDSGLGQGETPFVWPVSRQELETDYGTFPFDHHFPLSRMDMIVCGDACAPAGRKTREMGVLLSVGSFEYAQHIFGDRQWRKKVTGYRATDPEPFERLPLILANAYGGKLTLPYGEFPCLENPVGKGFVLEGHSADGLPLPNIERPMERVRKPYDIVRPTCMAPYPLAGKLRFDPILEGGQPKPFEASHSHLHFGHAHPDLMLPRPAVGTEIRLKGMHPTTEYHFQVPDFGLEGSVTIDGEDHPLSLSLDGICIFAQHACVGFKYRAAGRFALEPRQTRSVTLRRTGP